MSFSCTACLPRKALKFSAELINYLWTTHCCSSPRAVSPVLSQKSLSGHARNSRHRRFWPSPHFGVGRTWCQRQLGKKLEGKKEDGEAEEEEALFGHDRKRARTRERGVTVPESLSRFPSLSLSHSLQLGACRERERAWYVRVSLYLQRTAVYSSWLGGQSKLGSAVGLTLYSCYRLQQVNIYS